MRNKEKINLTKLSEKELKELIVESLDDYVLKGGKIWKDKTNFKLALKKDDIAI